MRKVLLVASLLAILLLVLGCGGTETSGNEEDYLLNQDFNSYNDDAKPEGWTVFDEANATESAPSDWKIKDHSYYQGSNIYGSDSLKNLYGTFSYAGSQSWTDYIFQLRLKPADNDAVGVIFRHSEDADSGVHKFYRYLMIEDRDTIQQGPRHLLHYYDGEKYIQLAECKDIGYTTAFNYYIKVEVQGSKILVYRDGIKIFEVTDTNLSSGNIGLYCSGEQGVYFDDVKVSTYGQ